MSDLNEHIEQYLDYYLKLKGNVGFAVLLNGDWGCGKTWFIKRFISKYKEQHSQEQRFLYITLYGVNSYAEIEDQIFQQLHPILSSKPMALTGKILKGALKASLKVDFGDNSSASIEPDLEKIPLPGYLKKTDDCVLVFDDLERVQMPITGVLGYINSFVEHQGSKVVIVGNESELDSRESAGAQDKGDYRRIKEKIGR